MSKCIMDNPLKVFIAVGLGGMIGAVLRYSISLIISTQGSFPIATLFVNLIGCFLLSFILNKDIIKQTLPPELFLSLTVGIIGSFTTFSTVTVETIYLWEVNNILAVVYVLLSFFGGLLFCYGGYKFGKVSWVRQ